MSVALFATCLADTMYPEIPRVTVRVIERVRVRVAYPQAQTCCGQMHINGGYQRNALPLVRHFVDTFEPFDRIVLPSASCAGSIRDQHAMVARRLGDERLAERADAIAERTFELSDSRMRSTESSYPLDSTRPGCTRTAIGSATSNCAGSRECPDLAISL